MINKGCTVTASGMWQAAQRLGTQSWNWNWLWGEECCWHQKCFAYHLESENFNVNPRAETFSPSASLCFNNYCCLLYLLGIMWCRLCRCELDYKICDSTLVLPTVLEGFHNTLPFFYWISAIQCDGFEICSTPILKSPWLFKMQIDYGIDTQMNIILEHCIGNQAEPLQWH